jgi:hypothetical protein
VVTPPRNPQTDEQGLERKTLMLKTILASSIYWIKLFLNQWCDPVRKP